LNYEEGDAAFDGNILDVLLDAPVVKLDNLDFELDDLRAKVSLFAKVLDLVELSVGIDAYLGRVKLTIEAIEVQALLKVRLDNVRAILDRILTTIDRNPQIIHELAKGVSSAVEDVGEGAGEAVEDVGEGAGQLVGEGANEAVSDIGSGAASAVEDVGEGAGSGVGGRRRWRRRGSRRGRSRSWTGSAGSRSGSGSSHPGSRPGCRTSYSTGRSSRPASRRGCPERWRCRGPGYRTGQWPAGAEPTGASCYASRRAACRELRRGPHPDRGFGGRRAYHGHGCTERRTKRMMFLR
jgi:hypothetical protein